ncbi:MAG: hypothetical protein AABX17_02955 [Nanoarchaeota archaeon]
MKISSAGLELEIYLSSLEVILLKHKALEGVLQFREVNSDSKKPIPLTLKYKPGTSESVIVTSTPAETYFGDAKQIDIELQDYLYACLVEQRSCGDRFSHDGKVLIYAL